MSKSRGKDFENKVKADFSRIPDSHIERLFDVMTGYKAMRSRSDFVAYVFPNQFWIECKSHYGNTFPFSELRQYEDLLEVAGIKGIRSGIVLWMIDHDIVVYLPVKTVKQMKLDGKKSFNIKDLNSSKYRIIVIPSKKKRVYMDSDYSILTSLEEGD